MEEGSFPRGRVKTAEPQDKDPNHVRRKRSKSEGDHKMRRSDDILFGKRTEDKQSSRKKRKQSPAEEKGAPASHQSLLPLGGGAVVLPKDKSGGGDPLIEGLGFAKLSKGFRVLGCVREVHADLAVFSLPNLWTGYMLRSSDEEPRCDSMLQVGQFLSVVIVKAVQEPVKGGGHRRRIQVSCLPNAVNKVISAAGALSTPLRDLSTFSGAPIRCQIMSIEDHGVLMNIGNGKKGFLKFSDIGEEYVVDEDMMMTDEVTTKKRLVVGRVLDCLVKAGTSADPSIISLSLPSRQDLIKHTIPSETTPSLAQLQPGMLVQARVERFARNGLCVTFCGNMFRGAIEVQHLGGFWIPTQRQESEEWKQFFKEHRSIPARIIAVDVSSKIIRLSLQSHILEMEVAGSTQEVGNVIQNATVVRLDRGVGALLAYEVDKEGATEVRSNVFKPLSSDENYRKACENMAVYVHISKAMDKDNQKLSESEFGKEFAPSTKHDVRIVSASNWIDGIASGAAAPSIVDAQVISYADIKPAAVYKQVPVTALLDKGGVLVDLGMGVKGVVPDIQLFDKVVSSEYRTQLRKVKFSPGTKVDLRVLTVDSRAKRCVLTAKKSMVKTDKIIKSFNEAKIGDVGTGFVSKVDEQGLMVTFFDGVHGRLTARSLSSDAGVENHKQDYSVGDVLECRVTNVKRKSKRKSNERVQSNGELNGEQSFCELTLGLNIEGSAPSLVDDHADTEAVVKFSPGAVLPLKSMRIVELIHGKSKGDTYVPGYAIVNVKAKYLTKSDEDDTLSTIDCKLPFDQLLDEYDEVDIESADALDRFAESMLTVGKKVNRKGFVLLDPKKSATEYSSGTGTFAMVSIRPRLTEALLNQIESTNTDSRVIVPDPTTDLYKGARLVGYVSNIDKRHGAFIRYLDGLTGLVPKQKGGLLLRKYSSLTTEVVAVDKRFNPPKLLVKACTEAVIQKDNSVHLQVGDVIDTATVTYLAFHQVSVELDAEKFGPKEKISARIHCTMARSTPLSARHNNASIVNTKQEISACHPFHGWVVGQKISHLKVVKVESKGGKTLIELTNDDEMTFLRNEDELSDGKKVSGIIYSVKPGSGLWISVSPGILCHIPALEASQDVKILNALEKSFPVGGRLHGTILSSKVWFERRSKNIHHHRNNDESKEREPPIVSLLDPIQFSSNKMPEKGGILIARVNRFLSPVGPPSLMLDLRGGFVGRCCITELDEPDDWENTPLGQSGRVAHDSSQSSNPKAGEMVHEKGEKREIRKETTRYVFFVSTLQCI
jgi:ribosomal protein S1